MKGARSVFGRWCSTQLDWAIARVQSRHPPLRLVRSDLTELLYPLQDYTHVTICKFLFPNTKNNTAAQQCTNHRPTITKRGYPKKNRLPCHTSSDTCICCTCATCGRRGVNGVHTPCRPSKMGEDLLKVDFELSCSIIHSLRGNTNKAAS